MDVSARGLEVVGVGRTKAAALAPVVLADAPSVGAELETPSAGRAAVDETQATDVSAGAVVSDADACAVDALDDSSDPAVAVALAVELAEGGGKAWAVVWSLAGAGVADDVGLALDPEGDGAAAPVDASAVETAPEPPLAA